MKTPALISLALVACTATALAVDPPPGGDYPNQNTALGQDALFSLGTNGDSDTAIGFQALYNNTDGSANTAIGNQAVHNNTTGFSNCAVGSDALYGNTTGTYNVAIGENAMVANTTGGGSVAIGYTALQAHSFSSGNVAIGFGAMSIGLNGTYNTAIGNVAMAFSNGSENTAVGDGAMNTASGSSNIAIGRAAGANLSGDGNIVIGQYGGQNLTSGANNIEIGNEGAKKDSETIRLGAVGTQKKTFVAGISGTTVADGAAVMVNSKGQLGVVTSSARYKEAIQPMAKSSDALLALKPVTFRYKKELDPEAIPQFGLVAEQVAKVDPDLVVKDESGKPYTVRYEAVNAMLLNEFLKEHQKVEAQARKIAKLAAKGDEMKAQAQEIEDLRAELKSAVKQMQNVSAQMQRKQAAPRLVSMGD